MEQQNTRLRNAGFATFFFSGICAISAGVVVSLLQERYGFAYGMTGTLLSLMSVGNLLAGLLMGMLPSALGMKRSVLLLTIGYAVGYAVMGLTGAVVLLDYVLAFMALGLAELFARPFKNRTVGVAVGTFAAGFLRFMCSFLSGVLVWGNLSDGLAAWTYSLTYNGSYMLPETLLTMVAAVLLCRVAPQIFDRQAR